MPASARAYPPGSFSCFVLFADEKNDVPAKREKFRCDLEPPKTLITRPLLPPVEKYPSPAF